jgi:hypothetical protein
MGYKINERNTGNRKLDGAPKKRSQKLTMDNQSMFMKPLKRLKP